MPRLEKTVQWYPGHMAKATRRLREYLALADIVIEVVDARIVRSGRNPLLDELAARRARIVALDRQDLADSATTKQWLDDFGRAGHYALAIDGRTRKSVGRIAGAIARLAGERKAISRAIVVGIPNAGKSSIINALLRRAAAKTEDRAGVTRQLQWFRLAPNAELMDTPGILMPKIADSDAQWKLAICGAVPPDRYDPSEVAVAFHQWLSRRRPRTRVPDLGAFAAHRGFVNRGGTPDYHNAARSYIRAFNDGTFGRISFEAPDDAQAA